MGQHRSAHSNRYLIENARLLQEGRGKSLWQSSRKNKRIFRLPDPFSWLQNSLFSCVVSLGGRFSLLVLGCPNPSIAECQKVALTSDTDNCSPEYPEIFLIHIFFNLLTCWHWFWNIKTNEKEKILIESSFFRGNTWDECLFPMELICYPSISSEASTDIWNGSAAHLFAMEGAQSCGKKYMYCRRKFWFWTCAVSFWYKTPLLQTAIWTPLLPVLKIAFYNISNAEPRQHIWLTRRALAKGKLWQKMSPSLFLCTVQIKWYTLSSNAVWSLPSTLPGMPMSKLSIVSIRWSWAFREFNTDRAQLLKS